MKGIVHMKEQYTVDWVSPSGIFTEIALIDLATPFHQVRPMVLNLAHSSPARLSQQVT